jgi:hypothetical protein
VKHFEPVAHRVVEHDQILDAALAGERAGAARDLHAALFEMHGERVERAGIGDFPAVKAGAFAAIVMHHHALLAVVHAKGERRLALVDELHAEETAAVGRPILEILRPDADIA